MARRQEWQKDDNAPADDEVEGPYLTYYERGEFLVRHLTANNWRTCREGVCRRHHACVARKIPCWDPAIVEPYLHDDTNRFARAVARMTVDWKPKP